MKVAMTFDNGPHPEVTPEVLRVLQAHKVKAHFFVVGSHVRQHGTRWLIQAVQQGHRIGNHSYHHGTPLGRLSGTEGVDEVELTQRLIEPFCAGERLFRPFGGRGTIGPHLLSPDVWAHLQTRGYSCVLWNCLAYEWDDPVRWVEPTLERCLALEHSVVVLHDLPTGAMARLDEFIVALKNKGAEFSLHFPQDCLPLRNGKPTWSPAQLDELISLAPSEAKEPIQGDIPC